MKTDLKKLTLNQETLMNLTDSPADKAKIITFIQPCLETNCRCCHGKF